MKKRQYNGGLGDANAFERVGNNYYKFQGPTTSVVLGDQRRQIIVTDFFHQ